MLLSIFGFLMGLARFLAAALWELSIDMTEFMDTLLDWAGTMFNNLIPVFGIVIGISLGIGLLYLVYRLISEKLPHG